MTEYQKTIDQIEDEAERFPAQMLLAQDVFKFSFAEAKKIALAFNSNAELFATLDRVSSYVAESELEDELKGHLMGLLTDEAEVIAFSRSARCSVIAI